MRALLTLLLVWILAVPARAQVGDPLDDPSLNEHCPRNAEWLAPRLRDHPLVGCHFDGRGRPVTPRAVIEAVRHVPYVLLGETHDNADHHAFQNFYLQFSQPFDRFGGSLVLEMVPRSLQPVLDRPEPVATLGERLRWEARGWPMWTENARTIRAALAMRRTLVAGDLDRDDIRRIGSGGEVTQEERRRLGLDRALSSSQRAQLAEELKASHCGMMPETMIEPMTTMQRARDGALAAAMREADRPTVLLAGSGHVRRDRGVPAMLDAPSVSIAFIEVREGADRVTDYELTGAGNAPLYDFAVFTPAAERGDPCAGLRERFGKKENAGE